MTKYHEQAVLQANGPAKNIWLVHPDPGHIGDPKSAIHDAMIAVQ